MSISNTFIDGDHPHLVFLPSGIGNLTPFLRLAIIIASRNCKITLINIQPQAHVPELTHFSNFISNHPRIELLDFEIHPSTTPSDSTTITDPFMTHIQNINNSLHLLTPTLSSLSLSAIFSDFAIAATMAKLSVHILNIPLYLVSTTSALFFSLVAYLPVLMNEDPNIFSDSSGEIEVPGLRQIPISNIPSAWTHKAPSNYLLNNYLLPNARSLSNMKGVILNTFDWFELETVAALNGGRVLNGLPPVFPIGPLKSHEPKKTHHYFSWLDEQVDESVVYVDFGRREVMSKDQTSELEKGLQICGHNYLWVNIDDTIHEGIKKKGILVRDWVDIETVLAHPAIGIFVNQCEWGSVMEAAWNGVPILAWPQHGDHKMNAESVEKSGLGTLIKVVEGKEIGRVIKEMMGDLNVTKRVKIVKEKAREACEFGGSSENAIEMLMSNIK